MLLNLRRILIIVFALAIISCKALSQPERISEVAQISGEQIFQSLGCSACHIEGAGKVAPSLHKLFGSEVELESGATVIADEDYLRESVLSPDAKTVAGYQSIMPGYQGRITEDQLQAVIEYILSLAE